MITLDGRRLEDFGYRAYLEHEHPATPNIYPKTMNIPGRPGTWNFGAEIGIRQINIPVRIQESDKVTMQQKQNDFIAFLFDGYGKPRQIKLTFDYEPDKYYMVELEGHITPSMVSHFRYIGIPFVAHDPYKYSNINANEVVWGSTEITFEAHYLLGHTNDFGGGKVKVTGNKKLNLSVSGLAVQPIFEIEGTANNLTINANGHSFTLPDFSNTKWVVDFNRFVVFRNNTETFLRDISVFYLMPGSNEINVTGTNINIDMQVKFKDRYI